MRSLCWLLLVGCASSSPPPPTVVVEPVRPNEPVTFESAPIPQPQPTQQVAATLQGTIGGKPFVPRAALMIQANVPMTACSSALTGTGGCNTATDGFEIKISTIRILSREVRCADLGDQFRRRDVRFQPNEASIEIRLQGNWPTPPRSVRSTDERDPRRDQVTASFQEGWSSGAIAKGTVEVLEGSPTAGVLKVDLRTSNPNLPTSGSVSGSIPFVVCN